MQTLKNRHVASCGMLLCLSVAAAAAALDVANRAPLLSRAAGRRDMALVSWGAKQERVSPLFTPPEVDNGFALDGLVLLQSTDPIFVKGSKEEDPAWFATSVAKRMKMSLGVPMARFTLLMQSPKDPTTPGASIFCASKLCSYSAGVYAARYAGEYNASFVCKELTHHLNKTVTPGMKPIVHKEDPRHRQSVDWDQYAGFKPTMLLQSAKDPPLPSVTFEVGVLPPTGVDGDTKKGKVVAAEIVRDAAGPEEPQREMIPDADGSWNGHWSYEAGPSVKFLAMFPSTKAAFPREGLGPYEALALPLGPLLGGRGAEAPPTTTPPPPKPPPGMTTEPPQVITELLRDAHKSNQAIYASIKQLDDSLKRASQAHKETLSGWMLEGYAHHGPYVPSFAEPSAPLLPEWP
eukprot:gnl/TRDRNA2_/TRDRNA2_92199_c0_seq1.p1 gnl/TRDRNA2_/TRDRNA2_92199_c0~~gnl/TRDRNA2_/TRDRNA2_92199_c0_seq1.p1  ORF type:complete len:405 (+),score=87.44 gnl/TRDRNA2_/TRDRNA2_92199_c0_seq1:120-1334(+)